MGFSHGSQDPSPGASSSGRGRAAGAGRAPQSPPGGRQPYILQSDSGPTSPSPGAVAAPAPPLPLPSGGLFSRCRRAPLSEEEEGDGRI